MTETWPENNAGGQRYGSGGIGGFIGGLLGGAAGTLGGTNTLQTSIDQLTNAVNRLSNQYAVANPSNGTAGNGQSSTATKIFPGVNNPFSNNAQAPGIGGGGPGGVGNVQAPQPFGKMTSGIVAGVGAAGIISGITGYGQQQLPTQLGLNAYSTVSQLGMNTNGGYGTINQGFMQQAFGMYNRGLNNIASSPMDALAMAQQLQFVGGNPMYQSTALGRAGFNAAASFGLTNPLLSGSQSAALAQQLYNPVTSQAMIAMGYGISPRQLGGGNPRQMGQVSQAILRGWFNKNSVSPTTLFSNLSQGSTGYQNLRALGLNPSQFGPVLEGYNQLFRRGLTPTQADQLFTQAAGGNGISRQQSLNAQKRLTSLGVSTSQSDIQRLKNNQSIVTGRSADVADGFNKALDTATNTLQGFNAGLSGLMTHLGLNGPMGALGGITSVFSGTNHGNILTSLGGAAIMARLFGGGGAAGAGGAAAGAAGAGGGIAGAGLLASIAGLVPFVGGAGIAAAHTLSSKGSSLHTGNALHDAWNTISDFFQGDLFKQMSGGRTTTTNIGGGAAGSIPTSTQQKTAGGSNMMSGISASAVKAVSSAESQIGVPYVWGGEMPGVGFDCSGLMQWAWKQAGVNLPRTSQSQWASLKNRSVAMNQVQEGDLVFQAGSDGTASAPGHVGMMISRNQLIQAPYTGANVQIIGYNPRDWQHAARPNGKGPFLSPSSTGVNMGSSSSGIYGNRGLAIGGAYGSSNEVDIISAMGGGLGMSAGPAGTGSNPTGNGTSIGLTGITAGTPKGRGAIIALAKKYLASMGWANQWNSFNALEMGEAGWNPEARNPTSGAYGLPQALPPSKMASAGPDWKTNPATQLRWMMGYLKDVYGGPDSAYQAWLSRSPHWYGDGTKNSAAGVSIVGERGPEIMIDSGGKTIIDSHRTGQLLKAMRNQPAKAPWTVTNESQMISGGSGGNCINLNIGANAIVIKVSSTSDASSAGREVAKQIVKHLQDEQLYTSIGSGDKL